MQSLGHEGNTVNCVCGMPIFSAPKNTDEKIEICTLTNNKKENFRGGSACKARSIPRMANIKILCIFYPKTQPGWKDEIPVAISGGSDVWLFKPVRWLDDVKDFWLGGGRTVCLTQAEKQMIENLPWFLPWLGKIQDKRQKKRKREEYDESEDDDMQHVVDSVSFEGTETMPAELALSEDED